MFKLLRLSLVALLLLTVMSVAALAQSTVDGAIGGIAKDPQGAIIPNATVAVRNVETNKESTVTTDSEGRFRVAQLQPGNYSVVVNASGFGTFTQEPVVVEVGRITTIEAGLQVGNVTGETVNVSGEAPVINTERQDFSTNVNQTSINELPINGRRASDFVRLSPGVVPDGAFGLTSFRGISGLLNNSTVDGGDNNQAFFSEERGRTRIPYVISQAAVREFQVNTSNYSAEYGRAAGGVINTITKSGTNEFHGGAFFYDRDNKLGARNPFSFLTVRQPDGTNQIVGLKPTDRRLQFGGTIGGPIVKDKLFFFFSYDQQKQNFPAVAAPSSTTFFNLTAANQTTLTSRGITNTQRDAGLAFLQSLTGTVPRRRNQTIYLPKIDWNINNNNTFTATFNRLRANAPAGVQSQAVVSRGIASFGNDFVNVDSLNLRLASTLSPKLLNEARFQYGRDNESQIGQTPAPGEPTTAVNGTSPSVAIGSGGITIGQPNFLNRRAFPDEKRLQFADTITLTRGNQTFKFGGDVNRVNDLLDNLFQESGAYSYSNLTDFLSDFANPAGKRYSSFNQGFGPTAFRFNTYDYNFFVQDDIRVSPRLTLNLGLRYEYEQLPNPQIANPLAPGTSVFPSDKNNFGPRFGFAYDLTGDGKTSLRGGYGIYYGRIINSTISNAITNTGSALGQRQFSLRGSDPGSPTYPNVLAAPPNVAGSAPAPDIIQFASNTSNPMIHQADIVFERQISRNTVVSVSGLLSLGRALPTFVDTNLSFPNTTLNFNVVGGQFDGQRFQSPVFLGARPNTNFGRITEIRSTINSEYEGLVLQANRRLTKGLQFQTNYTLSRALDNGQGSQTFSNPNIPLNPFDLGLEGGTSTLNVRHRFNASVVYNPTFFGDGSSKVGRAIFNGFTIAPIVQIASGRPDTGTVSNNLSTAQPSGTAAAFRPTSLGIIGAGGSNRPFFIPRNAVNFPHTATVDLRVSRRFRFTETANIEFLAEGFNIFNRTNVTDERGTLFILSSQFNNTGTAATNPNFGQITGATLTSDPTFRTPTGAGNTIFRERQIQLAVRFQF
ncbi:MAG: TonB-dependent receptor domain-containing protein [Pyrinomonadaceae bacterium]